MRQAKKSVDIKAPVERVFDFMTRPENLPSIWPSMIEVSGVQRRDNGWNTFDWTYKMAGMRFHGHATPVEVKPNELLVMKNESGIPSTFRWRYEKKDDGGTRLTCEVEYTIPAPLLGRLAEAVVARMNDHELELMLANAKATLEEPARAQPVNGPQARP